MTELEVRLLDLGRLLDVPEAPDLVDGVLGRIGPRRARRPRRWTLAVALVLLAGAAATLAIPSARSAFLRILHIGGESIAIVDELPQVRPELNLAVALGDRITLEEARRGAGFRLRALDERPDAVYRSDRGTIWFLYGSPEHVRLLVAQTRGGFDQDVLFKKVASPGTHIELVSVAGSQGAFLSGKPHFVLLLDENGTPIGESTRLARNVLVWAAGGVAYRLEGGFTKRQALELARSLR
jgi:hypothetical protein